MAKVRFVFLALLISTISATQFPQQSKATDWAYRFVVWNDTIYIMSEEYVTEVGEEIGQVTSYSDLKPKGGNFSNAYPKGTKYYAIKGVDRGKAIDVQQKDHTYKKAYSEGIYEYKEGKRNIFLPMGIALLLVMIIGTILFGNKVRK